MVERHRDANPVVGGKLQALADVKSVQQQIAMAERGRFGKAGRAGRVLDVDRVGRVERFRRRRELPRSDGLAAPAQVVPGDRAGGRSAAQRHDPAQAWKTVGIQSGPARLAASSGQTSASIAK